jgi:hypothetical protein
MAVLAGTAGFGALMMLAPGLTLQGYGWLMFGQPQRIFGFGADAVAYITLLHGVLGAVMVGWALALWGTWRGRWSAWTVVATSVTVWFVIDTVFSAAVGAWPNVALNLVFGALFAAGLWLARPVRGGKQGSA